MSEAAELEETVLDLTAQSLAEWHKFSWWEKIVWDAQQLREWSDAMRARGCVIAMTAGNFDPLHAGHLDGFAQGREIVGCQARVPLDVVKLLVCIDTDETVAAQKPGRPAFKLADRLMMLAGMECVTAIAPFRGATTAPLIAIVKPAGYFKGNDRSWSDTPERGHMGKTPFYFVERRFKISSTELVNLAPQQYLGARK